MSESQPAKPLEQGKEPHEEDTSISRRPYVLFCVIFIAALLMIGWLLRGLQASLREALPEKAVSPWSRSEKPPPSPQLQGTRVHPNVPHEDLQAYLKAQRGQLDRYEWIDRRDGIARIPIDRALVLLLERGLPTRSPPTSAPAQSRPAVEREHTTSER